MRERSSAPLRIRHAMVIAHRWLGLIIAAFLVVLGATGSLIAFNDELEAWFSPHLFRVAPPYDGAPFLDPFALRDGLLARYPGVTVNWVELSSTPNRSTFFGLEASPGASQPLPNDQVFVDPYTGRVLGERLQADLSQGWKNFMPFVYVLHTSLALGDVGTYAMGIAALLWSIDCFVGFYLTLPARRESRAATLSRRSLRQWVSQWRRAWKVRGRASSSKVVFDLHRAGGLWTWIMLLVLAWSGVGFNLAAVYQPVMRVLGGYVASGSGDDAPVESRSIVAPLIGWGQARQLAKAAMNEAAIKNHFTVHKERLIHFDPTRGLYEYRVLSTLDVGDKLGNTTLFLDAYTGALIRIELPTGQHAGNTVDTWLSSLHTTAWGGVAMQVIVCVVGLAVVILSITGVWIWWRRYRAKRRGSQIAHQAA